MVLMLELVLKRLVVSVCFLMGNYLVMVLMEFGKMLFCVRLRVICESMKLVVVIGSVSVVMMKFFFV